MSSTAFKEDQKQIFLSGTLPHCIKNFVLIFEFQNKQNDLHSWNKHRFFSQLVVNK